MFLPEITANAGLDFTFEDGVEIDGTKLAGSATTVGQVELGVGILLSRNVFLTLSGAFGVTDDSPDATLGMALPVRF